MPAHQEANMIEIVHAEGDPQKPSQTVMMIRSSGVKTDEQSADEKLVLKLSKKSVEPAVAVEKGSSSKVATKQEGIKLPVEGTEHNRALYLTVKCEDSMVTRVLVDNGSSANICLSTLNKRKVDNDRIHKNSICVRGFDGGGKDSVGDIILELTIGPVEFTMEFQVLDVAVSYNLLLGRPWIHAAKAVPSTLH
ncbi:uncharacterized protein [Nicotiana sylvestris]|uniref:uncharacterized protein n=1 Tax=Nicotiana sylvestris TaxID=4096 RepID=UPI00388C5307